MSELTITARALGRKYGMKGKGLRTLRLRLQRLRFLGRAERGRQTYPLLREGLPETGAAVRHEYESKFCRDTIASFVEGACAEIEALAEEMQEWQDGVEGTGLEYTSTYDEVVDCVSALEYVDLECLRDVPEEVYNEEIVAGLRRPPLGRLGQEAGPGPQTGERARWAVCRCRARLEHAGRRGLEHAGRRAAERRRCQRLGRRGAACS